MAKSMAGMDGGGRVQHSAGEWRTVGTDRWYDDAFTTTCPPYKGIAGTLGICAGSDCKVGGDDTNLAAADKLDRKLVLRAYCQ